MKTKFKYIIAALCVAPLMAVGCQSVVEMQTPTEENAPLIVTIADVVGQTRTTYDDATGKFAWEANDTIAVYYQDKRYDNIGLKVNAEKTSEASLLSSSRGSKVRDFYAVYPASVAELPAEGATAPSVTLPSEYDLTGTIADYVPAILLADNNTDLDTLKFYHAGGVLKLILQGVESNVNSISVTFDKDVTGTYIAVTDDTEETHPYIKTKGTSSDNVVTFTGFTIASDNSLKLSVPVPCGTYEWIQVKLLNGTTVVKTLNNATSIEFARHHGKRLAFTETSETLVLGALTEPEALPEAGGVVTLAGAFESYKTDGTTQTKIPFHFEYSEDGTTWSEEAPSWLSASGDIDYGGSVEESPQEINFTVDPLKNVVDVNDYNAPMGDNSKKLADATSPEGVFDLSLLNVATGVVGTKQSTANCYVVQAHGTYKFPLVYGNAIKNGKTNEPAFHSRIKDGTTYSYRDEDIHRENGGETAYLAGYYKDHLGNNITKPYIEDQVGSLSKAQVLWMDMPGLIESVSISNGYVNFSVPKGGISEGNAVIGVFDANNKIAWSWHIWFVDIDLKDTKKTLKKDGVQYDMSPAPVGFVHPLVWEKYEKQECYVRAVQDYVGGLVSDKVLIQSGEDRQVIHRANVCYFAPGRKDPIAGTDGLYGFMGNKPCYPEQSENDYYPIFAVPTQVTLAEAIQNPHIFYCSGSDYFIPYSKFYANLWNSDEPVIRSTNTDFGPVTKTIYDPSPSGYTVPSADVWSKATDSDIEEITSTYLCSNFPFQRYGEVVFPCMGSYKTTITSWRSQDVIMYNTANTTYSSTGDCYRYYRIYNNRLEGVRLNAACTFAPALLPQVEE